MSSIRLKPRFFRVAFIYCTAILSLVLLRVLLGYPASLPSEVSRALDGAVFPLAFTSALALALGLPIDLEEAVPYKMLCGALVVAAFYAWGRWVSAINFRSLMGFIQELGARRGRSDVLAAIAFTFIPAGGLIDLISFLFLGLGSAGMRSCESEGADEPERCNRDDDRSGMRH